MFYAKQYSDERFKACMLGPFWPICYLNSLIVVREPIKNCEPQMRQAPMHGTKYVNDFRA
jgi:hypothetical protein